MVISSPVEAECGAAADIAEFGEQRIDQFSCTCRWEIL
jgi:hypothetical protein